ncbi:MAG: hypothetical protein IPO73_18255 [Gemmatimonadetes bacterium]|nr:hypothetical protein [Gemmatimonadota bacterium]
MASYWRDTRAPRYSLLFALPLLALYELLARLVTADSGIRNGADVLLKSLFLLLGGRHGLTLFAAVVLGTGLVLVIRDWRKSGAPAGGWFLGMFAESALYATCFGGITSLLTGLLLRGPAALALVQGKDLGLPTELVVSLGAGIYEELLFRVVLVGLLARLALAGFGWRPGWPARSPRWWAPRSSRPSTTSGRSATRWNSARSPSGWWPACCSRGCSWRGASASQPGPTRCTMCS